LANSGDFPEKITLMSSSYTVSYYTSFTAKPEEPNLGILLLNKPEAFTLEHQMHNLI
jgi:hypothetical protein